MLTVHGMQAACRAFKAAVDRSAQALPVLVLYRQTYCVAWFSLLAASLQGYGAKGIGEIPGGATLELDVELLSVKTSPFGSRVKIVEGWLTEQSWRDMSTSWLYTSERHCLICHTYVLCNTECLPTWGDTSSFGNSLLRFFSWRSLSPL